MASCEPQDTETLAALSDLQQQQPFADFTLQLKEGPVHVSRILLAAISPVFRAMLSTDTAETRNSTFDLQHVTMETWTCISHFYFTSHKLVTVENAVDVVEASQLYGLDRLKEYCSDFLLSTCSPDNCLVIRRIAGKLELESVAKAATGVLAENFSSVCKQEDFSSLEKVEILKLLEKEELVTTEDDLCQALLTWMENNDANEDTCKELFQHVCLKKVSDLHLGTRILFHNIFTRVPSLQSQVRQEVTRRLQQSPYRKDETAPQRRRPRCNTSRDLLAVGYDFQNKIAMWQWSVKERRWIRRRGPDDQAAYCYCFSSAVFGNTVVVAGGLNNKKTFLYDTESRTWTAGPDLLQTRRCHGMAVVRDKVYVVAGFHKLKILSSIEEYSQASGQWTHSGYLQAATMDCGVTALGDTILVVGGNTEESVRLIQGFNVETRTAAVLDVRLPRPMYFVQAATLGTTAFFVGRGGDEGDEVDLVQIRELNGTVHMTNQVLLRFGKRRRFFGLHVSDSCVRVIGRDEWKSVECWNYLGEKTRNDEVEDLPEGMNTYALLEIDIPSS